MLGVVLVGGLIADRLIVSYISSRNLMNAPQTGALPDIFARSPAAGKAVNMPIEAPDLIAGYDNDDSDRIDRGLGERTRSTATPVAKATPRRWFVEPADASADALAQAPVHLSQNWYSGFSRPSVGQGRLRKGSDPQDDGKELVVQKQIRAQLRKEGAAP
jgi:hypothetical protein